MIIDGIELRWLGHASFTIKERLVIYIDPYNITSIQEKADIVLITHSHYDHCSLADIEKVIKEGTKIFFPVDCQSILSRIKISVKMEIVQPNQELKFGSIKISTLPAYNIDKNFHPKNESWVGYLIKMNGVIIYHAGDTDFIPEMKNLTGFKQENKKLIALLPVGGRFTMNSEEAFESAKTIKPFLAIPCHWGSVVGTKKDAEEFLELCKEEKINAEILEKS
ncbi:MBL fold metallo-hydrolase [Candidatus Pacearchaeota archaeon]|nr:MBL fold metallo-hydrolase [Candidatus Pacearchaeota archaeon]